MTCSKPEEIKLTRMGAADLMRHCATTPADAGNCLSCIARDNCAGYYNKIAEILDDPLGTCWVSVEEHLPRNDADVLAYKNDGCETRVVPANFSNGQWFDCLFDAPVTNITHWMYVPKPPRKGDRRRPVVPLDCKIGDVVYPIIEGKIVPMEVMYIYINRHNKVRYHAAEAVYEKNFRKPGIGKDVFLTREDAEAALTKGNNVPSK